ncbi:hypothetical protein BDV23DRAFT_30099 [Aspergillus alliaceus]|uniref:Uncharacterized protein n=1 Tax=Petromyces alliaceus TaxID=209559 RepID=A0A5N7BT67_PETAA|nr:hypothetical protein BDV23DRAFT_30099 [Aspergillus alliaceus]
MRNLHSEIFCERFIYSIIHSSSSSIVFYPRLFYCPPVRTPYGTQGSSFLVSFPFLFLLFKESFQQSSTHSS